jgi:hypothetical protein
VPWWNLTLTEEESAWTWAQHYALEWSAPMQSVMDWALGSYRDGRNAAMMAELAAAKSRARTKIGSVGSFLGKIQIHG